MGTEENPKWSSLAEEGQSRLIPAVQISPLSLHTLVFSTLGLNVRWSVHACVCGGVRACAWSPCMCECPSTSTSVLLNGCCGPGLGDPGAGHPWAGCRRLSRASKRLPISLLSKPPRQARPRFPYRWLKAPSGVQLPPPESRRSQGKQEAPATISLWIPRRESGLWSTCCPLTKAEEEAASLGRPQPWVGCLSPRAAPWSPLGPSVRVPRNGASFPDQAPLLPGPGRSLPRWEPLG